MDIKEQVFEAIKNAGKPVSGGEVEQMTGIDRKSVDKAMNQLKKEELIELPIRCKWQAK